MTSLDLSGLNLNEHLAGELNEDIRHRRLKLCKIKNLILEKLDADSNTEGGFPIMSLPGLHYDDRWVHLMWRRQKDSFLTSDTQPDKVASAIRLVAFSKHRSFKHLPMYDSFEVNEHCLKLKLAKPPLNLRECLGDRKFRSNYGHLVIKGLLEMLGELEKAKATLHSIQPKSLFLTENGKGLMAVDLFAVVFKG